MNIDDFLSLKSEKYYAGRENLNNKKKMSFSFYIEGVTVPAVSAFGLAGKAFHISVVNFFRKCLLGFNPKKHKIFMEVFFCYK